MASVNNSPAAQAKATMPVVKDLEIKFRTARLRGVGRNSKCPCASGLKFKRCCMRSREVDAGKV